MNYPNLKDSTVFDFASDAVLDELGLSQEQEGWLSQFKSDSVCNGFYLWSYAVAVDDADLIDAVKRDFDWQAIQGFDPD